LAAMNNLIMLQQTLQLFGIDYINPERFLELIFRFFFNLLMVFTIVRFFYYPLARRKDYFFTFILVGVIVFLLSYSLINVRNLTTGIALGLFAIFGILRFRTSQIPIKEMTYLFLVIGVSVINALVSRHTSYAELLFVNLSVLLVIWLAERFILDSGENRKVIVYENIELIKPENRQALIDDLRKRTGLHVTRVQIGKIDFLRDSALIRIFYTDTDKLSHMDDEEEVQLDNDRIS